MAETGVSIYEISSWRIKVAVAGEQPIPPQVVSSRDESTSRVIILSEGYVLCCIPMSVVPILQHQRIEGPQTQIY